MTDLMEELQAVFESERREHTEAIRSALSRAADGGLAIGDISDMLRRAHSLKGAAHIVGMTFIKEIAHAVETALQDRTNLPEDIRRGVQTGFDDIDDWLALPAGNRPEKPSKAQLAGIGGGIIDETSAGSGETAGADGSATAETLPLAAANPALQTSEIRINADSLDALLHAAGELHNDLNSLTASNQKLVQLKKALPAIAEIMQNTLNSAQATGSVTLSEAFDDDSGTHDARTAQHHIRILRQLNQAIDTQSAAIRGLRRNLKGLNQSVRTVRQTPAGTVFVGFRKMVRDIARAEGKSVEIDISGLDAPADRRILQQMKAPIMHLLRNAISHGIETREDRRAAGKAETGSINLTVERHGEHLRFIMEDDGRGLNLEKIRSHAVKRGLLGADPGDTPGDAELSSLIFAPGFSTAANVTEISGRGLGMSVVRQNVNELQGHVEVTSHPGRGTTFTLSVPAGFVTQPMLLFEWQGQALALPSRSVIRMEQITAGEVSTACGHPVVTSGGHDFNLISLGNLLGHNKVEMDETASYCLYLQLGGQRFALLADKLIGVHDCVVYPPDFIGADRGMWAGVIIGGDGELRLVINTEAIALAMVSKVTRNLLATKKSAEDLRHNKVLIVDDSITIRTLEKSILEAHGYDVSLGIDGLDALGKIRSDAPNLVISDIEMPHMNGFELLAKLRGDPQHSNLPLILVTSFDKPEHKKRAMELGANAYIVKQRFDQHDLLDAIERLI